MQGRARRRPSAPGCPRPAEPAAAAGQRRVTGARVTPRWRCQVPTAAPTAGTAAFRPLQRRLQRPHQRCTREAGSPRAHAARAHPQSRGTGCMRASKCGGRWPGGAHGGTGLAARKIRSDKAASAGYSTAAQRGHLNVPRHASGINAVTSHPCQVLAWEFSRRRARAPAARAKRARPPLAARVPLPPWSRWRVVWFCVNPVDTANMRRGWASCPAWLGGSWAACSRRACALPPRATT